MMADQDVRVVFESADPARIAFAKSLLESADIDYLAAGEHAGALFSGNPLFGRVRIQVAEDRADEARALLDEVGGPSEA